MNKLRPQAQNLRDMGHSYSMITSELGISRSTLSNWFSKQEYVPSKEAIKRVESGLEKAAMSKHTRRIEQIRIHNTIGRAEVGTLSKRDLWMLGIGIYIGEGAKSIESVRIMNSDPAVIAVSMRWFKEVCDLSDENIIISMHLYPDSDVAACSAYWQKVTGLPLENFRKTQIDRRLNKKRVAAGKLPYGTVQLRIRAFGDSAKGVTLFRRIMGWIDGAVQQV